MINREVWCGVFVWWEVSKVFCLNGVGCKKILQYLEYNTLGRVWGWNILRYCQSLFWWCFSYTNTEETDLNTTSLWGQGLWDIGIL